MSTFQMLALSGVGYVLGLFGIYKMIGHTVRHAAFVLLHGLEKTIETFTPDKIGSIDTSDIKQGEIDAFNVIDQFVSSDAGQTLLKTHIDRYFKAIPAVNDILNEAVNQIDKDIHGTSN